MKKIDLNKLSFSELKKQVESLEEQKQTIKKPKGMTYCIVRTYSAGVFAGLYNRGNKGKEGTVYQARRVWYWKGANSLSQMANDGVKYPNDCKFAQEVSEVDLKEIIEVLPCTLKAEKNLKGVSVWEQ